MIQGVALALIISASLTILAIATENRTRGVSMGLYDAMRMVGLGIGPVVGGLLEVNFGFEATFLAAGAFVFLAVLLVQIWVGQFPTQESRPKARPFRIVDRELISTGIVGLFIAATMLAMNFTQVTTLENEFNFRLQQSSLGFGAALSTLTLVRILVQIPLGRLSDRIGRKPLIISGLILMTPTTILLGYVTSTLQLALLMALMGLTNAAIASPAYALAADQSKVGGEARQMSFVTLGFGVGMIVGPLLAGTLATISFQLPFLFNGTIAILGAWIVHRYVFDKIQDKAHGDIS
jgi:MFS family permease